MLAGLRLLFAAALLALPLWSHAGPAYACTGDFGVLEDRVRQAELIVIGTPSQLRLLGALPVPTPFSVSPPSGLEGFTGAALGGPAEIIIDVQEYLKGTGRETLTYYQFQTTVWFGQNDEVRVYPGAGTTCDRLAMEQPHLMLLQLRADGRYDESGYMGVMPLYGDDEHFGRDTIEQIGAILREQAETLPPLGTGDDVPVASQAFLLTAGGGALLLASVLLLLGSRLRYR